MLAALLVGVLLLPGTVTHTDPWLAGAVLAGAAVLDLVLLLLLPRLGLSFGWIQPPWLMFASGRSAVAALLGLVPLGAAGELALLVGSQALLTLLALYGSLVEPFWIRHTRITVPMAGLAASLRLLLLTDLHVERLTRRELSALDAVEREKPDLIVVVGDLLNLSFVGEPRAMEEVRRFLRRLDAPAGVLYVRGTVDVDPPRVVERILDGVDRVHALENEVVTVQHGGATLDVVGIPADAPHAELCRRLERLAGQARPAALCLHHTPDLIEAAARTGRVGLYLAGHTHGGQICFPLLGPVATASRFGRRYVAGLFELNNRTLGYVSKGLGLEGLGAPRIRFLARPELVWITLESASC